MTTIIALFADVLVIMAVETSELAQRSTAHAITTARHRKKSWWQATDMSVDCCRRRLSHTAAVIICCCSRRAIIPSKTLLRMIKHW
jgi:hypothetical protein